jgi:hypothetical protein
MVEEVKEHWTIVIVGKWNTAIFSPEWLTNNVFQTQELSLEFGMAPGMPRRITAEKVTLIPTHTSLILAPTELDDPTLLRMEGIACKILDLLTHTPVANVGINFGYRVTPALPELLEQFPSPHGERFASQQLTIQSREFLWTLKHENQQLRLSCQIKNGELFIKFNFHSDTPTTSVAKSHIAGKIINHRMKTKSVLEQVFGITMEGNQ